MSKPVGYRNVSYKNIPITAGADDDDNDDDDQDDQDDQDDKMFFVLFIKKKILISFYQLCIIIVN